MVVKQPQFTRVEEPTLLCNQIRQYRCAHGATAWLRTLASKVSLWCGSEHRPKYFNEGTYTVVTDDRTLDDWAHNTRIVRTNPMIVKNNLS